MILLFIIRNNRVEKVGRVGSRKRRVGKSREGQGKLIRLMGRGVGRRLCLQNEGNVQNNDVVTCSTSQRHRYHYRGKKTEMRRNFLSHHELPKFPQAHVQATNVVVDD